MCLQVHIYLTFIHFKIMTFSFLLFAIFFYYFLTCSSLVEDYFENYFRSIHFIIFFKKKLFISELMRKGGIGPVPALALRRIRGWGMVGCWEN